MDLMTLICFIIIVAIIVTLSSGYIFKLVRQQTKTVGDYVSIKDGDKTIMVEIIEELGNSIKVQYWETESNICIRRSIIIDRDEIL